MLTRESHKNVVCQAALEQVYEIENVAATEGTDFLCKPTQLVITKFINCESDKELLSGLQHVHNTDLHLKLIDLDPNRGIIYLFCLSLENFIETRIYFQISINKSEANQLFSVMTFFVL